MTAELGTLEELLSSVRGFGRVLHFWQHPACFAGPAGLVCRLIRNALQHVSTGTILGLAYAYPLIPIPMSHTAASF